jgi:FkbM family methyltransferase
MNIYNHLIKHGSLCYDIGANHGNKTDVMLSLGARVVCVEPQDSCFSHLEIKYLNNPNVQLVHSALGEYAGSGEMLISQSHTLSTMSKKFIAETTKERFPEVSWDNSQDVEITTLDELIAVYGIPEFTKIDVEGFELEVLKGLHQAIPALSIEFTPELKQQAYECIDIIQRLGNYRFEYSEAETHEFTMGQWVNKEIIIEFLSHKIDFVKSFGDIYARRF